MSEGIGAEIAKAFITLTVLALIVGVAVGSCATWIVNTYDFHIDVTKEEAASE